MKVKTKQIKRATAIEIERVWITGRSKEQDKHFTLKSVPQGCNYTQVQETLSECKLCLRNLSTT